MNLRAIALNPNLHIALGIAATVASIAFPAWAPVLQAVAVQFGVNGIALPEKPIATQPAAPIEERSLHTEDYLAIAARLAELLKARK